MNKLTPLATIMVSAALIAQTPLQPLPQFTASAGQVISIVREAVPAKPFSVVGPRGALLGQQDGSYEGWIFPWKIFSDLRITAEMKDYPVPIDVNQYAASIDVQPDHTTITFAHANFTIRETLFAPQSPQDGAGALAFYQIEAVRPMVLTFHFVPEMKLMWPALSDDRPSPEWIPTGNSGFYVLHLNFPDHAAALAIPDSHLGIFPPYQERPKNYPLDFVLPFDPATDSHKVFPLLIAMANTTQTATSSALSARLHLLSEQFQSLYQNNQEYYRAFLDSRLRIETPDKKLNAAFSWAEIAINQLRVQTTPRHDETALVAGFYGSGDSARPGFGWYFGRDALWTLFAVNSYGDFQLTRNELEFLARRQSPEGKIIHEWAQTANLVDWKSLPYEFASSDATPLFLMAMNDYYEVSGDSAFLQSNWQAIARAWGFETSHDSDGDGIYEDTEGSGWVESWPPGMPHQEIYLAALDQQASSGLANMARVTGHAEISGAAARRAKHIEQQIEKEYFSSAEQFYAFSRNANGTVDASPTIYPAVAAWDGTLQLVQPSAMLSRWASSEFSTDWGTRDLSPKVSFYDPISYHQGTVWPLFTGWVSLAEYRSGRSLSGYAHLMQNADLTWAQDLGDVTELLSGEFFAPLGRSTAHQLWSSAMVISPVLRGMFGLEWNGATSTLTISPQLPAEWAEAKLLRVPIGNARADIEFKREGRSLLVRIVGGNAATVHLQSHSPGATGGSELRIPLPSAEIGIGSGLPEPGSMTSRLKVLDQKLLVRSLVVTLSAPGNSHQVLFLRVNDRNIKVHTEDAKIKLGESPLGTMEVDFPDGSGYMEKKVTLRW